MPGKTVLVLQHAACESPGLIGRTLEEAGFDLVCVHAYRGDQVPRQLAGHRGLVIMGGPMGVYDGEQFPFLLDELRLIEDALRRERPILGVCLGSQLLASALGSAVKKGREKEIGWHQVTFGRACAHDALCAGAERTIVAYHWHGDVFDLPRGSTHLASSLLTHCQAFRQGPNAYGFLFHMEVTPAILEGMTSQFAGELRDAGIDPECILGKASEYLPPLEAAGLGIFRRWAGLLECD